jgi:hypothetical protein
MLASLNKSDDPCDDWSSQPIPKTKEEENGKGTQQKGRPR